MSLPVVVLGAGGGGVEIAEAIMLAARHGLDARVAGFLDDDPSLAGTEVLGWPVLGRIDEARHLASRPGFDDLRLVIGIASDRAMRARDDVPRRLGLPPGRWLTFVHPSAQVSPSARLGAGAVVMEQAVVGPRCTIGAHVRLSARACVGHDARLADGVVVAPAATLSGRVQVGPGAYVGAAAVVRPDVTIGARALVGLGAVVVGPVDADTVVVGHPARPLPRDGR